MKSTLFSARRMEQEDIVLNEVSQTREEICTIDGSLKPLTLKYRREYYRLKVHQG